MPMTNGLQLQSGDPRVVLWKKALATAVSACTSVLIINIADPAHQVFSKAWFYHILVAMAISTVVFEAKYWKEWADKILGNGDSK